MEKSKEYDVQIGRLFDLQRFQKNDRLARMIEEVESRYTEELSDDDLFMVSAAGDIDEFRAEEFGGEDLK